MKKLLYIAGPYSGDIPKNIENAEEVSIRLIREGYDVITPHKNTAGYEQYENEKITYKTWIDLSLNILSRCDILFVMKNSEFSNGVQTEIAFAKEHKISIIYETNEEKE